MNYIYGSPARRGPEADLVLDFITSSFPSHLGGLWQSIFIEHDLGSSVPDIVIVYWDQDIANKWPTRRRLLRKIDYKLIQYLYLNGPETENNLLRFFPRDLPCILNRLTSAAIIFGSDRGWELKSFEEIFAVKQIISFEAKISASMRVFEQALLNSTFSSETYVVTKTEVPKDHALDFAKKLGVGIWCQKQSGYNPIMKAREQSLPQSYLSWHFNNLVWEYSLEEIDEYKC